MLDKWRIELLGEEMGGNETEREATCSFLFLPADAYSIPFVLPNVQVHCFTGLALKFGWTSERLLLTYLTSVILGGQCLSHRQWHQQFLSQFLFAECNCTTCYQYAFASLQMTLGHLLIIWRKSNWVFWWKTRHPLHLSLQFSTCSTIDANLPNANPLLSSRVMTALPNLTTKRRAYFNWLRSENVVCCWSPNWMLRFSWLNWNDWNGKK